MGTSGWLAGLAVAGWAAALTLAFVCLWRGGLLRRRTPEAVAATSSERDLAHELVQHAPMIIILLDRDARIVLANPFTAQLMGCSVDDLIGQDAFTLALPPSQIEVLRQILAQDFAGHVTAHLITPIRIADGRTMQVEWYDAPLRDAEGQPRALLAMGLEVTERLAAQEALAESERTLRGLVTSSQDGIALIDEQGLVIEWNAAQEAISSLPAERALGRPLWELQFLARPPEQQTPETYTALQAAFADFARTGEAPWLGRLLMDDYIGSDSARRVMQSRISPIHTDKGHRAVVISRNITDQVEAEEALRASEARYRGLVESLQEGIWVVDAEAMTSFVNLRMAEMLGYAPEEMIGRSLYDFVRPEDVPDVEARLEARAQGVADQRDVIFPRRDGSPLYLRMAASPVTDGQGRFAGVVAALMDISAERREAEALLEREERYFDLIENAGDLIQSVSPEGAYLYVNRTWREALGYDEEEVHALNILDVLHLDCRERCLHEMEQVLQGERLDDVRVTLVAKDGHAVHLAGSLSCRMEEGKPVATRGVFRLLTEVDAAHISLTPICATCKKVRGVDGDWQTIEDYLREVQHLRLTHGICPDCMATLYAEFMDGAEAAE